METQVWREGGCPCLERCPHFRGWYVQALGPEDVSLLERCPHIRGWYIQASMEFRGLVCTELGPEDVSLCPHFNHYAERVYNTVTLGCPAHHCGGYKNGGLKKLLWESRSK